MKVDLYRFYRNLHLKAWYHNQPSATANAVLESPNAQVLKPTFKPKSKFFPHSNNACLNAFVKKVNHDVEKLMDTKLSTYPNLSRGECDALKWLQNNENVVIRQADKGGATIVWGKEAYTQEALRQLMNTSYYAPLSTNPMSQVRDDLKNILDRALEQNWINANEYKFLLPSDPKIGIFYLLPKIHKDPLSPPGRPIISGVDTITEPTSKYIDFHIKPLTQALPAYLQDTTHVLKKLGELSSNYNPNYILVTMDVEALYTNIDHSEGLCALEHYLQNRIDLSPPTDFLVELTRWTLNNNFFLFQDKLYRQVMGTAMGAAYAPNYAGLYLGLWEERYVLSSNNPYRHHIQYYGRYIDDLLFVFSGSVQQLKDFHLYLNSINHNIKLSLEFSTTSINFLDLNIYVDSDGTLHTTIYRKPTDKNTILRADSFHPNSLISNIPYGQFQRLRRICDSDTDFETQSAEMYERFKQRGYKDRTLNSALSKSRSTERTNLFKPKPRRPVSNRIFCSLQYTNQTNSIKQIIKNNWDILRSDTTLAPVFSEPPQFAVKRAPTLKDKLVKNYIPATKPKTFLVKPIGTFQCGACRHCPHINKSTTFTNAMGTRSFHCKHFANCNSTHVVYRLDCKCGCFYIGLTKRRLRDRFGEHKYAIKTKNMNYPIAKHFQSSTQCNPTDLKVMVIEVIQKNIRGGDRLRTLAQRESFWIDMLQALSFPGLNEELDFSVFL